MPFGPGSPLSPFSPLGPAGPVIPVFPDFPRGPMGPRGPFFPFGPLLPRGPLAPMGPGYPGGPEGHTFSLDLQYLVGLSCSNCLLISFLTSCMVTPLEVSFKRFFAFLPGWLLMLLLETGWLQ